MGRPSIGWLLVGVQAVLLAALALAPHTATTLPRMIVGGALAAGGIALGAHAFVQLGSALTPTPVPLSGAGLRTDGPYRFVRHPIYTAVLLVALAFTVAFGSPWTWLILVLLVGFFWGKSRWEDTLLREEYGEAWHAWAHRTGALLPRSFGRSDRIGGRRDGRPTA